MQPTARRALTLLAAAMLLAPAAPAYYYFTHFTRTAPNTPVPEKFDLNALTKGTVSFYISEQGPSTLAQGDSFGAIISQVRAAAAVWNSVDSSALRLQYGGLLTGIALETAPGIDVVFSDDVPPGLKAISGPSTRGAITNGPNGAFVPIQHSIMQLRRDQASLNQPSYSEGFFLTLVHEFGHTLGLQHTLASSVMSTELTRATTKAAPLGPDDIAGISLLYPTGTFQATHGSIAGRVTLNGNGVNLACVVAMSVNGPVVAALTNPDGTYRIDGLPAGPSYYVYAHPLPPPMTAEVSPNNLVLPVDADSKSLQVGQNFETQFYPGTRDWTTAFPLPLVANVVNNGVNFTVRQRGALQVYGVQTYGYVGQNAVKPPYLPFGAPSPFLLASGPGLVTGTGVTPGLTVGLISGSESVVPGSLQYYVGWLEMNVQVTNVGGDGPRHMVFGLNNDIYVLPNGLNFVQKQPPSINAVTAGLDTTGNRTATVTGAGFALDTRIYFDGGRATVITPDDGSGRIVVAPPPASGGYSAAVVALNSDGQSSLFVNPQPPLYTYEADSITGAAAAAGINGPFSFISPNILPAGSEAMVEIDSVNPIFVDGQTVVGFGSSDIVVRRIWVLSPTKLQVNVAVLPTAAQQTYTLSVTTGLRVTTQAFGFLVQAPNPRQLVMSSLVTNTNGSDSIQAGSTALVTVLNAPNGLAGAALTLNDRPIQIASVQGNQIAFQVPPGLPAGPEVLKLQVGQDSAYPVDLGIDSQLPQVTGASFFSAAAIDATHPARAGDTVGLTVTNLTDPSLQTPPVRVIVTVGGVDHSILSITGQGGQSQVWFVLSPLVPPGAENTTVNADGRISTAYQLPITR